MNTSICAAYLHIVIGFSYCRKYFCTNIVALFKGFYKGETLCSIMLEYIHIEGIRLSHPRHQFGVVLVCIICVGMNEHSEANISIEGSGQVRNGMHTSKARG